MDNREDRELGMFRDISRRDFLNGVALTIGASIIPTPLLAGSQIESGSDPEKSPNYYPPALTGLRGSHEGSFEVAHRMRDGQGPPEATDTAETYDLIVIGGGISGLAASYFFRTIAGRHARVLVIENHDDFGGHAKRNEFRVGNRTLLAAGGAYSIHSPAPYSPVAAKLIQELGIDVPSFSRYVDKNLYSSLGLGPTIFFDKETFGVDALLPDPAPFTDFGTEGIPFSAFTSWDKFASDAPISDQAKRDLLRLNRDDRDYLIGLNPEAKKAHLAAFSYAEFLRNSVRVSEEVIRLYQVSTHQLFGVGIEAVAAQDAWGLGYPGFAGMHLDPAPGKGMNRSAIRSDKAAKYFFHFPDGNATIARLLVRKMIPNSIPSNSDMDIVTARANYARLDEPSSSVRIRLNSTAVLVHHIGDPGTAKEVEVIYVRLGKAYKARAKWCVLACWNVMIPYMCPELPELQKEALSYGVKVPMLFTNVALRNWTAFQKARTHAIYAPGSYHSSIGLDLPVTIEQYQFSRQPEDPIVVHMSRAPCKPGSVRRDQHRIGRYELLVTPFSAIERNVRQQLVRTLHAYDFDPARDIVAITANRWPHGPTYEYNSLSEGSPSIKERPCEAARKPFGRLSIANADADAYAYTDAAIDQAHRAVREIGLKAG